MAIVGMSCPEVWREISEMIDGTLDDEMRARMELHLRHCVHCKAVYDGTLNTVQLISDDQVFSLPPGFGERLLQRLNETFCQG